MVKNRLNHLLVKIAFSSFSFSQFKKIVWECYTDTLYLHNFHQYPLPLFRAPSLLPIFSLFNFSIILAPAPSWTATTHCLSIWLSLVVLQIHSCSWLTGRVPEMSCFNTSVYHNMSLHSKTPVIVSLPKQSHGTNLGSCPTRSNDSM